MVVQLSEQKEVAEHNKLTFNSGDFRVDLQLGKLVDDFYEGVLWSNWVSLNDLYSNFTINKSIYSPYHTLNITIAESKRILERFGSRGLQGEEFVKIKFRTPGENEVEDYFYVTGYEGVQTDEHESTNQIVLRCVSKEKLINDQLTINQSFNGPIEQAVQSIYDQYMNSFLHKQLNVLDDWKTPPINIHETEGVHPFIIPGLTPFRAIDFCSLRAFHSDGRDEGYGHGCFYTFYKTDYSFNFHNIEKRIGEDIAPNSSIKNIYTYDSDLAAEPHYSKKFYYNIKSMSPLMISNTLDNIHSGQYSSTVRMIDFNRKSFKDTHFNLKEKRDLFTVMGKEHPYTTKFFNLFSSDPTEMMVAMDNINDRSPWFQHIKGRRKAYRQMLYNYMFQIVINGNTNVQPGSVIKLELKEAGAKREKPLGSIYSGKWFVTDVNHICDRGIHNTSLTIVKDGLDFVHDKINVEEGQDFGGL